MQTLRDCKDAIEFLMTYAKLMREQDAMEGRANPYLDQHIFDLQKDLDICNSDLDEKEVLDYFNKRFSLKLNGY